ncbi:molecular chaperone [Trueperella sp. LYQ141]|uniref:TorD/DmsD family molecular chaperone n=1 Tax=Trueperella sp. LYQ141 TaxID=3391058 RepID=UPI0039832E57
MIDLSFSTDGDSAMSAASSSESGSNAGSASTSGSESASTSGSDISPSTTNSSSGSPSTCSDASSHPRRGEDLLPSANELEALASAFLVLSRFHLDAPDTETLNQVRHMYREWPLSDGTATSVGLQEWERSFAAKESPEQLRDDLNALYGRTARALVAPFESVHRGKDGLVFDEDTLIVRKDYRQLGLQAPHLHKEPDDHIGLEYDFIAQGLARSLNALDRGLHNDAQRYFHIVWRFTHEHLMQWAPAFFVDVARNSRTHFYRGVAELSREALDRLAALCDAPPAQ